MATGQSRVSPNSREISCSRYSTSYPTPRVPYEPRYDRSLRTLAAFTPAISASRSDETVTVWASATSSRLRRYTGSRATVASGIRRGLRVLGAAAPFPLAGGPGLSPLAGVADPGDQ